MTKKSMTDDEGLNLYDEQLAESIERTKLALIDNIKLANNVPFRVTETTIERLTVDHMRVRCDLCGALEGANKHTAVLVVLGVQLCWCCWFDHAFYDQHDWKPMDGDRYYNSPSRAKRRAVCSHS